MGTTFAPLPALARPQTVSKDVARKISIVLSLFLWIAFLNVIARPDLAIDHRLLASAICLITALPMLMQVWHRSSSLPFMPVYAGMCGAVYAWGIFLDDQFLLPAVNKPIPDDLISETLPIVLVGMVCLLAGYYLPRDRYFGLLPRLRGDLDIPSGIRFAISCGVIGTGLFLVRSFVGGEFGAFLQVGNQLAMLAPCMLLYYQLQGKLNDSQRRYLYFFLIMRISMDLGTGGIGPLLRDSLTVVATYWLARKQLPWKAMFLVVLCAIPLSGTKGAFRGQVWYGGREMSTAAQISLWGQLVVDGFKNDDQFLQNSYMTTVQRMDQLTTFCAVKAMTPTVIPYWGGESYSTLYWSLVPRFVYPDKPEKTLGQDFPHRYGLIGKTDMETSYNFPQLVELYANFGFWGIAVGMFVVGVILRTVYYILSDPSGGPAAWLFSAVLLGGLTNLDSDFSLVFGGLILNLIAIAIVFRVLRARRIYFA